LISLVPENEFVKLTLRKLNRCKRHLDDESAEIKNKMKGVPEKLHSLHLTEKDLAQQSHNKTYLIQLLRKKLQDTKNKLAHYRACEEEKEANKNTLNTYENSKSSYLSKLLQDFANIFNPKATSLRPFKEKQSASPKS